MLHINFIAVLVAAIVPMIMGFIWYNPKTLGTAWMKAAEVTEEKMKGANMAVIFRVGRGKKKPRICMRGFGGDREGLDRGSVSGRCRGWWRR